MDAKNKLLDKARAFCSRPSDKALSERLGTSPQLISLWRNGHTPLPEERITELCAIAHEPPGPWLLAIHAEQATGATRRAWEALARQLGRAAIWAGVALTSWNLPGLSIMSAIRGRVGSVWCPHFRNRLTAA